MKPTFSPSEKKKEKKKNSCETYKRCLVPPVKRHGARCTSGSTFLVMFGSLPRDWTTVTGVEGLGLLVAGRLEQLC